MLAVGLAYQSAHRARADPNENTVKIMTQSMGAGTDFGYLTGVSALAEFLNGAYFTYLEINASNIAPRAAQLASEITLNHPALVGLQEVTLWRKGPQALACSCILARRITLGTKFCRSGPAQGYRLRLKTAPLIVLYNILV
jgi:hypothetical protein